MTQSLIYYNRMIEDERMNRTNKLFKDEIRSRARKPSQSIPGRGQFISLEQVASRVTDLIPAKTVLNLLEDKVVVDEADLKKLLEIASSKDILSAEKVTQMEWRLKNMIPLTVRMIADRIIEQNEPYYSSALLKLVPQELLETELINENLHEVGEKIDAIRFKKEDELSIMLQMVKPDEKDMQRLREVINYTDKMAGELTSSQKEKIREIKFLNNLAQVIIHQ